MKMVAFAHFGSEAVELRAAVSFRGASVAGAEQLC